MIIDSRVTGKTGLIGVIGNPIGHSISPQLHNTISTHLGADLVYVPMKVESGDLENAARGLKALNFIGFNITIPHKKDIMKYTDENTREAELIGAVNTVRIAEGRMYGYNTDAQGFSRSFKEESGTGFDGKDIFIIGAGGTARAIAIRIAGEKARRIYIANRTASKAVELAGAVNRNFGEVALPHDLHSEAAAEIFKKCDIIINTTSSGMHPDTASSPINETMQFSPGQIVYDVIYNPVRTKFLTDAGERGCKTVNGLGMLFYQGIYAYEIWTGVNLSKETLEGLFRSFMKILNK